MIGCTIRSWFATRIAVPSVAAFAACPVAMVPPAPAVFSTKKVPPSPLGELLRQDARDDVVRPAWRIGHDQLDRLGGISLRNGGAILRGDAKQGQQYCCNPNDGHCGLPVLAL
jgi:hypothetical protein